MSYETRGFVSFGWGGIFRAGLATDKRALEKASSYVRLQKVLVVDVRPEGKGRAPRFDADGLKYRSRDFVGVAVASVPDTSVASRVCLVFLERVLEVVVAPRTEAIAFADDLAHACGTRTAPEIRIAGVLASDATFDILPLVRVLLVTLISPLIYIGALEPTRFLIACALATLVPHLRADSRARIRAQAYEALSAQLVRALEPPEAPSVADHP